ncbi:uncharacterized protein BJ212DRAFT_1305513 [Suillus subaureus]|uniref:Uncharacterized protein n=1 Tax=Suillus subaureus TaxID=48587 RepID=A0A9P7DP27_9AGAM|nr:uncharacterized protein BJ212DRAFT_1305513 [Suillus subaureus]KAG1799567.1 hypothetical protein BJ212DRAFT_1305513 [Suillus subaureus]
MCLDLSCNVSLTIMILLAIVVPINTTTIYITATSTSPSLSITSVHVPSYDANNKQEVWPHGMYTVDMAAGFCQLDDPTLHVPYIKATYHQNHQAWIEANPKIRKAHELAKYAAGGLWKHFLHAHQIATGKQIKLLGELEIELYGHTLKRLVEGIMDGNVKLYVEGVTDGDVNLGAVECTIARVDFPFTWILLIECFGRTRLTLGEVSNEKYEGGEETCPEHVK